MNSWFSRLTLLAQESRWREMGSGFRGERAKFDWNDLAISMLIISLVVLFLWGLSRLLAKQDRRSSFSNPRALFRTLCQAHNLSRPERRLLGQLAKAQGLSQPAAVFLQPECFEAAPLGAKNAAALQSLRKKLFAAPTATVPSQAAATPV